MEHKQSSRQRLFTGSALGVLAAAFFGMVAIPATVSDTVAPLAPASTDGLAGADQSAVQMPALLPAKKIATKNSERWIAAVALSGLIGSLFSIFGANRILQLVAGFGAWLGRGAKSAADASFQTARNAAGTAARMSTQALKKPGRWILIAVSLTVFVFTGISFLDIEWQAGLLTGAGITGAAAYGFDRTQKVIRKFMIKNPFTRASRATVAT